MGSLFWLISDWLDSFRLFHQVAINARTFSLRFGANTIDINPLELSTLCEKLKLDEINEPILPIKEETVNRDNLEGVLCIIWGMDYPFRVDL